MFGLVHPNQLYTPHLNQPEAGSTGREFSPRLWNHVLRGSHDPAGGKGFFYADDFLNFGGTVTSNVGTYGGYKSFEDTGGSIAGRAVTGGIIRMSSDGDNEECNIQSGYSAGTLGAIADAAASAKLTIFECRWSPVQIGNTYNAFIGLAAEGLAATGTITDAGALADNDFVGFRVKEADGDSLLFVHKVNGGAETTIVDGCVDADGDAIALAAGTFYNCGFVYDPAADDANAIKIYVNNVLQSSYVAKTDGSFAATFPDGEELAFLAALGTASTSQSIDVDWWAFYQEA